MSTDMEKRVAQYVAVRDHIDELKRKHEEELKQPNATLQKLAGILQEFLSKNNLQNIKTDAGTAMISTRYTATVTDGDAFMAFVKETQNFDLLERRASATAVRDYVEKRNELPTGVSLNVLETVGVRRPSAKS